MSRLSSVLIAISAVLLLCASSAVSVRAPGFAKKDTLIPDPSLDTIPHKNGEFLMNNAAAEAAVTGNQNGETAPSGDDADAIINEQQKQRKLNGLDKVKPCLDDCYGRGECIEGKCECFRLYEGEDCRRRSK